MRIKYLDAAKGISLLFVLMSHSCGFPYQIGTYCTAYFMAFFFVVSGYTQKEIVSISCYIRKRVHKLVIPYFQYSFLLYLLYMLVEGFSDTKDAFLGLLGIFYSSYCLYYPISTKDNIFFYRVCNNATWFLTAFFCSNLVFVLYQKFCKKKIQKAAAFLLAIIGTQMLSNFPIFLPWNLDKALIGAAFMAVGYELAKQKEKIGIKNSLFTAAFFMAAILYKILVDCNTGINLGTREYGSMGIFSVTVYFVIGCLGFVLCSVICRVLYRLPILGNILIQIGRNSLPIMCFHLMGFRIWNKVIERYFEEAWINSHYWSYGAMKIGVTCLVIIGIQQGIMKIKEKK